MKIFLNIIRPIIDTIRCLESGHRLSSSKQFLSLSKSLFALALLLLSSSKVAAAPITPKQAQLRATTFFRQRLGTNAAPPQLSLALAKPSSLTSPMQESATSAGYYIYNKEGGGYVIVSADDSQQSIIGYSDNGHIDAEAMPENMRWWLDGFYRSAKQETDETSYPDSIAPMLTSKWGQNAPYNQQTPLIDGKHAPAGCGAVALAQIIRYQQWPEEVGYIPSISKCEELPPTTFDWDKLLDTYDSTSPADCQEEVAKLMRYTGQAIATFYGKDASTIKAESVDDGCFSHLGFEGHSLTYRSYYDNQTNWENILYERSLIKGTPIFYGGEKAGGGGHAFVLDGYRDGYFHINWGWTGSYDGYFLLSDLSPNGTSTYNRKQYAILDLHSPYSDAYFTPSEVIKCTDMVFNPQLSREGCLTRENNEADFTDIVIQEKRSFTQGRINKKVQYGLALYDCGQFLEILADTLLDLSDEESREQQLTFRFSVSGNVPGAGGYEIRSVSRTSDDNNWMVNMGNSYMDENYYIVDITDNQLYLEYATPLNDDISFQLKTGFDTDEKYLTIDDEGRSSDNLKVRFNYNGGSATHYFEYGLGISTDWEVLCHQSILQQASSKSSPIECVFDLDWTSLLDGNFYLTGLYHECGSLQGWYPSLLPEDTKLNLVKRDNRIYIEPTNLVKPLCSSLMTNSTKADYAPVAFTQGTTTGTYDAPIKYIVSNPGEHGYADYGLGLFHDDMLQCVLTNHLCEYLTHSKELKTETVHIPGDLPEGEYQIKGIGRDANIGEWEDVSSDDAIVYALLRNDTLTTMNHGVYNSRNLQVDSIMYLNNYKVRVFLTNPTGQSLSGKLSFAFDGNNQRTYSMKVTLDKNQSVTQDIAVSLNTNGSFAYSCLTELLDGEFTIAQGTVKPLAAEIVFDNVSVESSAGMRLFNQFYLNYTAHSAPTASETVLVTKCVDEAGRTIGMGGNTFTGNTQTWRELFGFIYDYPDLINSKVHFELGYKRYYNDTVTVYQSENYDIVPFVTMQTYRDNKVIEEKQQYVDHCAVPENALYVSFSNASSLSDGVTIVPNHNPNTVYFFREDQPIPEGIEGCFVIRDNVTATEEFNIVDGYPVTNKPLGLNISYQRHFNADEWVLLGTPSVLIKDTEALMQFDEIMTFDRFEGNTLYFKKWDKDAEWWTWRQPFLVKSSERDIIFLSETNGDDKSTEWGDFRVVKYNIPCNYDNMYQLSPDGAYFYRTEGEVAPYRYVLLPMGGYSSERIRVVIEGYEVTTSIDDKNESQQVKARHTLDGRAVGSNYRGIIIETYANGATRKVVRR